jgi:hypothetical protein
MAPASPSMTPCCSPSVGDGLARWRGPRSGGIGGEGGFPPPASLGSVLLPPVPVGALTVTCQLTGGSSSAARTSGNPRRFNFRHPYGMHLRHVDLPRVPAHHLRATTFAPQRLRLPQSRTKTLALKTPLDGGRRVRWRFFNRQLRSLVICAADQWQLNCRLFSARRGGDSAGVGKQNEK